MTTKQRAYLKGLAMTIEPIFQCGKSSVTPDFVKAVSEALEKRELIKISVLQNCADDPKEIGKALPTYPPLPPSPDGTALPSLSGRRPPEFPVCPTSAP